ncbi:MAG: hypothetical protein ACOYYJ_17245 [Chloroflexota bacterium]
MTDKNATSDNVFDRLNEWVNGTEGSLVNFLTAFSPWLAPLAPAAMTYSHVREFLGFPVWLAVAIAVLVEVLGFGTVSTALDFWFYNRRDRAQKRRAPLEVVVVTFVFYLALVLGSNVVIDVAKSFGSAKQLQWSVIAVRALLTLQTIPGALIVAVRTGHRDLLREIKREKAEKAGQKVSETFGNFQNQAPDGLPGLPGDWRSLRPGLDLDGLQYYARLTPAEAREVAARHGVTERTVLNWRAQALEELRSLEWTPAES